LKNINLLLTNQTNKQKKVTVECKDRGEVLAKLRERYASLLSRVPREIKRFS
jgi:hypothetical protein